MIIRKYTEKDISEMIHIWNEVVEDGEAFPQEEFLDDKTGAEFFASQTYCGVADNDGGIVGLYILHPNNIGRCGHLANASYAEDNANNKKCPSIIDVRTFFIHLWAKPYQSSSSSGS